MSLSDVRFSTGVMGEVKMFIRESSEDLIAHSKFVDLAAENWTVSRQVEMAVWGEAIIGNSTSRPMEANDTEPDDTKREG